jgi:ribosomal protein S27E
MTRSEKAGGCLTLLALPFLCLAIFMAVDPKKDATTVQSLAPGLFFGSVLLAPGLALYLFGRRARKDQEFLAAVTGMVRTTDRFTVQDLSRRIGRTELETEGLVARIIAAQNGIDLVFRRATREYMHRARLARGERIVEQCPSCGAPTNQDVVFEGERVPCLYCGAALLTEQ